jgi:hypothetical protein
MWNEYFEMQFDDTPPRPCVVSLGDHYQPCPACGLLYDVRRLCPPRVPLDIRCACCCVEHHSADGLPCY